MFYECSRKYILYWGLRQMSDRNAALRNDGHLGYTDTLSIWSQFIAKVGF